MNISKEVIPICFATNDGYFPFMSVAIQSVIANASKERTFIIYILCKNVSEDNQQLLSQQLDEHKNFSVVYVNVENFILRHQQMRDYCLGIETYYRLLIPYIFTDHKKVIYLDCDTICLSDIVELYEMVPTNFMIAASRDFAMMNWKEYCKKIDLKNHINYFNAGVLVFNTEVFRSKVSEDELFEIVSMPDLFLPDQCSLNKACEGNTFFLNMSWNVMGTPHKNKPKGRYLKELMNAQKHQNIIHYVWDKPWRNFTLTDRSRPFWKYARSTKFVDNIYSKLKEIELETYYDYRLSVYNDIRCHRNYNLNFILKSVLLFVKYNFLSGPMRFLFKSAR
ncbi:MAG TPA: glycosyltransferase family 8 protein [Phnomibacter sp.]|nr:glycosyltransferase family 8 protein [Phnomibacter sp.]